MAAVLDWTTRARTAQGRLLRWALLVSLLLHLAILLGLPDFIDKHRETLFPGPLTARLVEPPTQPEPQKKVEPAPAPAPAPKIARPAPVPAKPAPVQPARSAPVLTSPAPAPSAAPAPAPAAAVEAAPAAQEPAAPASEARGTAPAQPFDETASIGQYRLALMDIARGLKRYPRLAQENNWQGRVELRIMIGAGGSLAGVTVKSSAGHAVLDQAALELLRRAHARTPFPAALRGREFNIEIPVIYGLSDG
jgi:protein TonB